MKHDDNTALDLDSPIPYVPARPRAKALTGECPVLTTAVLATDESRAADVARKAAHAEVLTMYGAEAQKLAVTVDGEARTVQVVAASASGMVDARALESQLARARVVAATLLQLCVAEPKAIAQLAKLAKLLDIPRKQSQRAASVRVGG